MTNAPSSDDEIVAASAISSDLLLYDFFKHISTLSLVALGGALGIAPERAGRDAMAIIVGTIGLAGGVAIMGLLGITRARANGVPVPKRIKTYRYITGILFSFGIGMFLTISIRAL